MDDLLRASAIAQAAAIRAREVSSEELTRAHLERIARVNRALNAVVQSDPEAALAAARRQTHGSPREIPLGPSTVCRLP